MRFNAQLAMILIVLILLATLTTMGFVGSPSAEKIRSVEESDGNRSLQSVKKDYTPYSVGPDRNYQSSNPETQKGTTGTPSPNIFSPDTFFKDLSSGNTDKWSSTASVDSDSAELVIGINQAQPDGYAKAIDIIAESRGSLVNTVSIGSEVIALVADIPLGAVSSFVEQMEVNNLARYLEPNMKYQIQLAPNDPHWNLQWGPQKIEADLAWDTTTGDSSVLVAVVDTGVDYDHPDLAQNYVTGGEDWVTPDDDPMDDHGHGTHCAGIIAAGLNNGIGIAGLANVSIMAEKVLTSGGWGYWDWIANGVIHATDQGAKIISMSLGGYESSSVIYDAVKYAYDAGVLIVAAAGNEGTSDELYPAAYEEVIAVTATDQYDNPAYFTNFGDWVEVAAPGVDIYSTVWDDSYTYMDGTSMATPHVSGTAALIWSQFPNMSREWVRAQLRFTADDLGDPGFDEYYGYGRINARKAVEQAPPDHDLILFDWDAPKFTQPGTLVTINSTILNFGVNNESSITVQLLVDDNVIDSAPIGFLASGTSTTVSGVWNAVSEGEYNVTSYVVPVPGESNTANNVRSVDVTVRRGAMIGIIETHRESLHSDALMDYYLSLGHIVEKITTTITPALLDKYQLIIVGEDWSNTPWLSSEIAAVEAYINSGKGFVAIGDELATSVQQIIGKYGISYTWIYGYPGSTKNFDPEHPIMQDVRSIYASSPINSLQVAASAYYIANDASNTHILISGAEIGGYVLTLSDDFAYDINMDDNEIMFRNIVEWIAIRYEHELVVALEAPDFLEPNESSLLNATVHNRGLSNETNVELFLLIEDNVAKKATIPKLVNGTSYTFDYLWTPTAVEMYNVTVYAPPVPNENVTRNNVKTKYVSVHYPLIRPVVGQWANYTLTDYDYSGRITGTGYLNFTYDHYVGPHLIYITVWIKDIYGNVGTVWLTVNTMNRWVENGLWAGWWYPGCIETNINIGSTVNLLTGTATVSGSRIVSVGIYPIDCWELPFQQPLPTVDWGVAFPYTFWYDKVSGLWIGMDYVGYPYREELRLVATNIPIGTTYEHELAAVLKAPVSLEPGDSSLLNASVYNVGLNEEKNVKLSIIIDGTEVESKIIPTLSNGTFYTFSYLWTPTWEAVYNVTAYAQPVPGEAFTANNAATKMVRVRAIKGYVLFDQTHYCDPIFMYNVWVNNITDRGYVVDTLATTPITPSALEGYDVFVIPQAHNYYSSSELLTIEEFVRNGGGLLVLGDDSPYIYTDLTRFAGITWNWGGYSGSTYDITPHPVTEGVKTAYFSSPTSCMVVTLPACSIIRDIGKNIMLAVTEIDSGAVIGIADENSMDNSNIYVADNLRLANNMIDWLKSRRPIPSFDYSPLDPYVGETVTFDASASYDPDGTIISYLWDFGDHAKGSGVTTTHAYGAGGTYNVSLTAIDNEGLNSTVTAEITVLRTTISVQVKVGSIHFRGEIAEFYVLVSNLGKPIDASINATLYYSGNPYQNLDTAVEHVSIGFYRIPYTIPLSASPGTYALIVEATCVTLRGVSLESFLLSPTLTGWNALLIGINGTVATIKTDLGLIKVDFNSINSKLTALSDTMATIQTDIGTITTDIGNIQLKVTAINGNIATIQTTLGTFEGRIKSIEEDIATIETDIGTVKVDVGSVKEGQQGFATPLYIIMIPVLIIAVGAILLAFFMRRKS